MNLNMSISHMGHIGLSETIKYLQTQIEQMVLCCLLAPNQLMIIKLIWVLEVYRDPTYLVVVEPLRESLDQLRTWQGHQLTPKDRAPIYEIAKRLKNLVKKYQNEPMLVSVFERLINYKHAIVMITGCQDDISYQTSLCHQLEDLTDSLSQISPTASSTSTSPSHWDSVSPAPSITTGSELISSIGAAKEWCLNHMRCDQSVDVFDMMYESLVEVFRHLDQLSNSNISHYFLDILINHT